jgi:Fe-S-cluster containining protein
VTGEDRSNAGLAGRWPQDAQPPPLVPGRSCGSCSLCCKLYPVRELRKPAGQWCVHTVRGGGCADHANRPRTCRQFFCSWLLDATLGPAWKPETARFVLAPDPLRQALTVMVDPGMPLAWKRAPYYAGLKQLSERLFAENRRLLVDVKGQITVVLPDRDAPLGVPPPGAEIVVWREGSSYGAKLQPPRDDTDWLKRAFIEAFEQAAELLDDPSTDDVAASAEIIRARNQVLDRATTAYAKVAEAECAAGCASCCHLMVMATPFEVLSIARHLLDARAASDIEAIKLRLRRIVEVPLDWTQRAKARLPCALLDQDNRCSIYEQRPSMCRVALSQSRTACEACLRDAAGDIPCVEQPRKIAAAAQMGVDSALISRRKRSIEPVELSRALLIALADYQGVLSAWLAGEHPFASAEPEARAGQSSAEKAIAAARGFGLAVRAARPDSEP